MFNVQLMSLADREGLTAAGDTLDALPQTPRKQAAEDATTAQICSSKDPNEVRPTAAAGWFLLWLLGGQLAATPIPLQAANVLRKRQKIKVTGRAPAPMLTFRELAHQYALPQQLMHNLHQAGWHQPSAVQQQAIPALLAGRELLVVAPTGGPAYTLRRAQYHGSVCPEHRSTCPHPQLHDGLPMCRAGSMCSRLQAQGRPWHSCCPLSPSSGRSARPLGMPPRPKRGPTPCWWLPHGSLLLRLRECCCNWSGG